MKKRLSLMAVLLLIFAMVAGSLDTFAITNQQKLDNINQQISAAKNKLNASRQQVSNLTGQISVLDGQINTTAANIAQTQAEIQTTLANIDVKVGELDEKSQEIVEQNNNINTRLAAMYKNGEVGYLEVLLGSNSLSELMTNIDMISRIYKQDEELMAQLQLQYDAIAETKRELEALDYQLEQQEAQLQQQKASLESSRAQAQTLRAQAQSDVNAQNALIDDLNATASSITALIQAEQAAAEAARKAAAEEAAKKAASSSSSSGGSTYSAASSGKVTYSSSTTTTPIVKGSGMFCLPAPSYVRISSNYGYRIHPISGTRKLHTGIDFAAPANSPCVAAGSGTVIYAGWYGGYGNAVVIDHGNGISTLYGHNNSILVSKGQTVTQGQQIARIGSTGNSTGPHCHFEVRINGSCVNPAPYL